MKDKTWLITGGSGSLGQALTQEILATYNPQSIRIFSNEEFPQYQMQHQFNDNKLRFLMGDVGDKDRLYRAMNGVNTVVHAAALKQIPTCEFNPLEAIRINIDGSANVIDCAIDNRVEKVLAISSDKAVHPINLYGATKLVMEKLFIQSNVYGKTKFSCVRFGNFEGSRGSVLPLWYEQAEQGEITVTDKEMTRFWITLEEAAKFAIKCLDIMEGKEIFIPKMPKTILKNMIPLNVKVKIIGKRQGEKLHELLFNEDEKPTEFDDFYLIGGTK